MDTKPSEQTEVSQSDSKQDTQQKSQQPINVCLNLYTPLSKNSQ